MIFFSLSLISPEYWISHSHIWRIIISFDSMQDFFCHALMLNSFFLFSSHSRRAHTNSAECALRIKKKHTHNISCCHNNCCQAQITLSFPVISMLFSGFTSYFSVSLSCQPKIYRCHNFAPSLRQLQTQMSECI